MQGKVEICGVNTAHLKTLKNDEMVELLRRSQAGDQAARGAPPHPAEQRSGWNEGSRPHPGAVQHS